MLNAVNYMSNAVFLLSIFQIFGIHAAFSSLLLSTRCKTSSNNITDTASLFILFLS